MKQHKSLGKSDNRSNRENWIRRKFNLKTYFLNWQENRIFAAAKRETPAFYSDVTKMVNKIKSAKENEKRFSLSLLYFNLRNFEEHFWGIRQLGLESQTKLMREILKHKQRLTDLDKLIQDALVLESIFTDTELTKHEGGLNEYMEDQARYYLYNKKRVQTPVDFLNKTEEFMACAPVILRTGADHFESHSIMSKIAKDTSAVREINEYMEECNKYGGWRTVEKLTEELKEHGNLKKFADKYRTDAAEKLREQGHSVGTAKDEAMFLRLTNSKKGQKSKLISSFEIEKFINANRGNIMKMLGRFK